MLTNNDIKMLLAGLDALQEKSGRDGLISVMFSAAMSPGDDKEAFMEEAKKTLTEAQEEADALEDNIILLKAKLIAMRQELDAAEAKAAAEYLLKERP
jgi:hypothetical protein